MALKLTGVLINVSRHGTTLECFINTQNQCQVCYNAQKYLHMGASFISIVQPQHLLARDLYE